MKLKVLYILAVVCLNLSFSQTDDKIILDSIDVYNQFSIRNNDFSIEERLKYANRARQLSIDLENELVILKSNKNLSEIYWDYKKYNLYKNVNKKNLVLSLKLNDSLSFADANSNLGRFYRINQVTDSAYYYYFKAEKLYRELNDKYKTAITLLRIALIQRDEKDFTGSELTSIEAISLLETLEKTDDVKKNKSYIYNNLGLVFDQLEQFEESIVYHEKALRIKKGLKGNNKTTIDNSKNNLALSYKNSGLINKNVKEYNKALKYYIEILSNKNLINERPDFYALVLDNYAHTLYLSNNHKQLPELYFKALKITGSVNPGGYNSIIINQHLAEYYNDKNNKDSAKFYAYRAKEISEQYHNDDLLKSLLLLSEVEEGNLSAKYLREYVKINDSLQKNERSIRNKFARIRFETKQIEQENAQIAKERMWLLIISVVLIISSFLLYLVISQINRNKELKFIQKQQETNEEIYNLMLSQNESIEEARTLEKKRISEELHDGVLGRLFGTRLSLDSLNMSNSVEAIKTREQYIGELKTIEQDIRKVSHELNTDFVSGSGFIDIIKTLLQTQTLAYELDYKLDHDDTINWDGASNKNKIHIYRIIQESLHNIYKHANATRVNISFKLKNNVICLIMNDDGTGFDVNKAKSGIGLKNMKSRVSEINGSIKITSEIDVGTTVIIEAPNYLKQNLL
ncbi:tetratricopeptide repeat-containing sensor histidine kinase [Flavivirga jejuensis]|uniref:Sensor histidine kinase n=1 Tax=Flavivirga jejuensis TaxID=870487 RepID=A0ABT8WIW3_9FLAO|nr:sensor histidine kinase [Flavivirga jejuensis]MDO5973097.1 sensor histidine kinase [Flavivirga jejuensis]